MCYLAFVECGMYEEIEEIEEIEGIPSFPGSKSLNGVIANLARKSESDVWQHLPRLGSLGYYEGP